MNELLPYLSNNLDIFELKVKHSKITTKIRNYFHLDHEFSIKTSDEDYCYEYLGISSDFGPPKKLNINHGDVFIFSDKKRLDGCEKYTKKDSKDIKGRILLMTRGTCTFYDKVMNAQLAGAKSVIFLNNQKGDNFRASTNEAQKKKVKIPSLLISQQDALSLIKMRSKPLQTFQVKPLPSIQGDPNAIISLKYRGEYIKNIMITTT
jgi:hypothetical protein